MKNYLVLLLSFFSLFTFSQTPLEKQEIINKYDIPNIEILKTKLQNYQSEKLARINDFLTNNKSAKRFSLIGNKAIAIFDIIDGKPIYISTDNINSAKATRTNFLHNNFNLGINLQGENMLIGVWDGQPTLPTHVEFYDDSSVPLTRVITPDFSGGGYGNHGTHVSGTLIAKGTQSNAKGMAPKANLVSYDWFSDLPEVLTEASSNALLISNHSYGIPILNDDGSQSAPTWLMGNYDTSARSWDEIAYSSPYYLHVTSSGNEGQAVYTGGTQSGYDKLTGEKNSKNNLVVANAFNPLIQANGDLISLAINNTSSQGPSDDGRIKPDITGDGTQLISTGSDNDNHYYSSSGTSMASPNIAGSLILLQQYYNHLHSQYMRSATLKAIACHTASDDANRIGPDPIFGWGLLNAKLAAETMLDDSNGTALILESSLANGETFTKTFSVSGTNPLSATICWTDPAGVAQDGVTNSPTPALVNDLDLRLTAPDGTTVFMPWKLQLSNISGSAITGDNLVDTVENIDIVSPVAGSYTLTVTHKGTITHSSQDFSLIVTGSDLTLGTKENTISDFAIWPNPADNVINYKFNSINNDRTFITLVDVHGRTVYNDTLGSNSQLISGSINTEALSQGIYFLKINQGNASTTKKVVIK